MTAAALDEVAYGVRVGLLGADQDAPPESEWHRLRRTSHVRLLEGRQGDASVVEVRTTIHNNRLHRIYRELRRVGVQVVHAEVRATFGELVQRLHLLEADGSNVGPRRLLQTLALMRQVAL